MILFSLLKYIIRFWICIFTWRINNNIFLNKIIKMNPIFFFTLNWPLCKSGLVLLGWTLLQPWFLILITYFLGDIASDIIPISHMKPSFWDVSYYKESTWRGKTLRRPYKSTRTEASNVNTLKQYNFRNRPAMSRFMVETQ